MAFSGICALGVSSERSARVQLLSETGTRNLGFPWPKMTGEMCLVHMDASWMRAVKHGINQSGRLEAQSVRTG